jgi:hypothetical protein
MNIVNSPDITSLEVQFLLDLSGAAPTLKAVNKSVGANLANVKIAFEIYSPNGVAIHTGDADSNPDQMGNFLEWFMPEAFPKFNGEFEWSGDQYRFVVKAKDSVNHSYVFTPEQRATVCRPAGNDEVGGNFGEGKLKIDIDCVNGEALIRDVTSYTYQGKTPTTISCDIRVFPPQDPTSVIPAPSVYNSYSQVLYKIPFSAKGYQVSLQSIKEYDLGNGVLIHLKYFKVVTFDVTCHYDLAPLVTEVNKLLEKAAVECSPELNEQLLQINTLLVEATIAKLQPTCGLDLGKIIDKIKEIGGFACDCECNSKIGFNTSGNTSGSLNIQFDADGDIAAHADVNGNNVLITIADFEYLINLCNTIPTNAFSFTPSENGKVKRFCLNVNLATLADDVLTQIGGSQVLTDKLRDIVNASFTFIVDGKCIIQTKAVCDYSLSIDNIPADITFVLFKSINIDGIIYDINQSLNGSVGIVDLQKSLNAINKGSFSCSFSGPGSLNITSAANGNGILQATLFDSSLGQDREMNISKSNCQNSAPFSASQIMQALINYLCKINSGQVQLGYDFVFVHIKADGSLEDVAFKSTDNLKQLIDVLKDNASRAVAVSSGGPTLSCETIRSIFNNTTNAIQPTDGLLGTRNKECGIWSRNDVLRELIKEVTTTNDSTLLDDWCKAVNICNATNLCNPPQFVEAYMDKIQAYDFALNTGACNTPPNLNCIALFFAGNYLAQSLLFDVDVTFRQRDANHVPQPTTFVFTMAQGQSYEQDVFDGNGFPALPVGYEWVIDSVAHSHPNDKFLKVQILNNGSTYYKIAYRIAGSGAPFVYKQIPATPGKSTFVCFQAVEKQYEVSVIAVCGPNNESDPVNVLSPACPAATLFNVIREGNNFHVTYAFPVSVNKFNLKIDYPNNGTYNQIHDVTTGELFVPVPPGVFGDFIFSIRSVCSEANNFYGAFSGQVIVNVPLPVSGCPMVKSLVISNVTDTTATITIEKPDDTSGVSAYTLIYTPENGQPISNTTNSGNPTVVWNLSSLLPNTRYHVGVQTVCGANTTSPIFDGGDFVTGSPGGAFTAYWGWRDVNTAMDESEILASSTFGSFADGATVIGDFRANAVPKYLWVAIPFAQPTKTKWFGSVVNNGNIGAFPETFGGPVNSIGGVYKVYMTNYLTQQNDTTIEFRNS